MGNRLTLQGKVVRIIKKDGKVLEYRTPLRVHQVLSDFEGQHAISEGIPEKEYLRLDSMLVGGRSYYLVPLARPVKMEKKKKKKKVRFADQLETEGGTGGAVVRVKLLISRRELQELLERGAVSVSRFSEASAVCRGNSSEEWKPVLEHIPEGN
ncbi:uncharacterized protein LOC116208616 [Punica granatum]|uniref:DUF4228 domain-containing protein n=2 Tax=Punica granatum TaxID=22663 RepID=A0A218XCW6_PUNGR|nr:uncharacterized protein LOC116208616 [Punica granatum]OWM82529.1 hypothetical protein CDL15_Pgr002104 [Punica granatum]PKI38517.1 hypothetical protein CRG98_041082 [Punica granatum]